MDTLRSADRIKPHALFLQTLHLPHQLGGHRKAGRQKAAACPVPATITVAAPVGWTREGRQTESCRMPCSCNHYICAPVGLTWEGRQTESR
ncbi:hypothetical protein AVEN_103009-1 [Araneus ventricosus]|uniref:Uncharacterized protein n=1 Tax=Araneus ventricosus TaxID=182803 RepID=A0A4Y2BAI8_ARAVE|nr:hypothetical protein AVEN_103009-1 [Araneus ventricosus]